MASRRFLKSIPLCFRDSLVLRDTSCSKLIRPASECRVWLTGIALVDLREGEMGRREKGDAISNRKGEQQRGAFGLV